MRQRLYAAILAVTLLLYGLPAWAADPLPLRARKGMVVAAEENAARAGVEMLRRGGNAVDAAVATAFALAVTHPSAGNLGGGGFLLIRFRDGRATFLDFRERAPAAASRNMYLDEKGELIPEAPTLGHRASGVPGTVAGLEYAWRKYGKLKWPKLVEPAAKLAKKGFAVDYYLAHSLSAPANAKRLERFPESKRIFLRDGRYYQESERFAQKELGRTLDRIRKRGAREFYEGRMAQELAAFFQRNGGVVTLEDLKSYRVAEREPVTGSYRGYQIISAPPPSSGGVALLEMLNILEDVKLAAMGAQSADAIHWTTEAMRRAFADRAQHLGDPDFNRIPVRGLTDKKYAAQLRASIDPQRASLSTSVRPGDPQAFEGDGETTHFSVVDSQGNAVAMTYTLNESYGSGVTAEGLGFLLNNEMDDFAAKPGAPNSAGLVQGEVNAIAPGKRPLSSMTPTVVTKEGKLVLVLGSPGSGRIITAVMETILNMLDYKMNAQQAVDAPRFHHQWLPDELRVEPGFSPDTLAILRARGHNLREVDALGDVHAIAVDQKTGELLGAADPRRGGKAVGLP